MRTMPFGVCKFYRFLPVGVFTASLWCIISTLTVVVAGRAFGENSVAAYNLVGPIFHGSSFLAELIATGSAVLFSLEMGRLNVRRAHERFSQGLWAVICVGILCGLVIYFGADKFLVFLGATDETTSIAYEYLRCFAPAPLLGGLMLFLQSMLSAEGDVRRCLCSFVVFFVAFALSLALTVYFNLGLGGCAISLSLAELAAIVVLVTHFFSRSNTLRIVRRFSLRDVWEMFSCSFGDASAVLCVSLLQLFATKFVIHFYGTEHLVALQAAILILGFADVLDGFGTAAQPLLTVYHGENNYPGLKRVLNTALLSAFVLAAAMMLILEFFPNVVVWMLGLTDPKVVSETVHVARLTAPLMLAASFVGILNSYYMCVEKTLLAVMVSFAVYLFFPIIVISCGAQVSPAGFWLGFSIGPVLGLIFFSLFLISTTGVAGFPYLFTRTKERRVRNFTLTLTEAEVVDVSRRIGELLGRNSALAMRVSLLVEEALLIVKEKNSGRKVLAEVTVSRHNGLSLTLRDDGVIFDLTDADAKVSSLRGFVVASLMERQVGRVNLITTGFNRNVFRLTR